MRTTIDEIAREAGVSTATVDRVLNNRASVGARTKASVLQVAHRLGYFEGRENEFDFSQGILSLGRTR